MPAIYGYSLFPFDLGHEGRHTYTKTFLTITTRPRGWEVNFSLVQNGADYFYFVFWPPVGHDHHTPNDPWTTSIRFRCGDGVAPEGVHNNFGHVNYFYFFSTPRWALGHFL